MAWLRRRPSGFGFISLNPQPIMGRPRPRRLIVIEGSKPSLRENGFT
jgi:hypothetical protein